MIRKIIFLIIIITFCLIGNYLSGNKSSPYHSEDPFLQDTVSLRNFQINVNVVYKNQQYEHIIEVNQMNNIHRIQSAGQEYIADYHNGTLQINQDTTLNISMAKVTAIFDFLENAKKSNQISNEEKEYIIDKDEWNQYLLDTSTNMTNSFDYAYPLSGEDIVIHVWKNEKYIIKISYQMNQDLQIEYQISKFNQIDFPYEQPVLPLPNPNLYNGKNLWNFVS